MVKQKKHFNIWIIYEQEKLHIDLTSQSSEEYERRIKELTERLGI